LVLQCVVFMFIKTTFGQDVTKQIIFDHYGVPQGFSSSQVLCIKKARNGLLWIGTEQGLVRLMVTASKLTDQIHLTPTTISSNYLKHNRRRQVW
jgi:ligand-binding sensor domain-containing protein